MSTLYGGKRTWKQQLYNVKIGISQVQGSNPTLAKLILDLWHYSIYLQLIKASICIHPKVSPEVIKSKKWNIIVPNSPSVLFSYFHNGSRAFQNEAFCHKAFNLSRFYNWNFQEQGEGVSMWFRGTSVPRNQEDKRHILRENWFK